jgi:hypothetical protein
MKTYITLVLFFIVFSITAEVRYVSKTGSSTAPYTSWKTACDSLQKCFDYCNNGDTVYVDRGLYRETIFLDNRVLTIIGIDTDECIIDGTGLIGKVYSDVLLLQKYGNIILQNITLKRKKNVNENYSYDYWNIDGYLNIKNCIFDTTSLAFLPDGESEANNCIYRNVNCAVSVMRDYKITISNSLMSLKMWYGYQPAIVNAVWKGSFEIYNNIIYTKDIYSSRCIDLCTSTGISIKNNLIYGFEAGVVAATIGEQPDTIEIINNSIIYSNITNSNGIYTGNLPGPVIIKNNIISGFKIGIAFGHLQTYADYNLFNNVTHVTNMPPIGEHNIVADPMFNNDTTFSFDAVDNFRLQKFSPAIDAGDPSILDVDGSRSDIGMFGGPGGISYEYQDLAPKVVKKLKAVYEPDTNRVILTWKPNTEADLKEYCVYKDINPNFTLDSTKRVAILTDTLFYDRLEKGTQKVYYKVTATDNSGNQSYPSAEVNVTITNVNEATITDNYEYALYQNYPNPFNPTTTISYSLKDESEVRIKIYSISGELIKAIIEGNKSKGYNETQIDLSNMASGIYLYRLEVTGKGKIPVFNDLKKMVLVK